MPNDYNRFLLGSQIFFSFFLYRGAAPPLKFVTLTEVCRTCGLGVTDLSAPEHFLARKLTWMNHHRQPSAQSSHTQKYICLRTHVQWPWNTDTNTHIQSYLLPVESTRSTSLLRNHFLGKRARQFHRSEEEKKAFLMGKNGRQGKS